MEAFPSEYQQLELNRYEKVFVRQASNDENYGLVLLKINPAMLAGEYSHAVITSKGIILCKLLPIDNASIFPMFIESYIGGVFKNTVLTVSQKLITNKALLDKEQKLSVRFSYICIFPVLKKADIDIEHLSPDMKNFIDEKCLFAEEFSKLRVAFSDILNNYLEHPDIPCAKECINICETNVNSILQRIAPEYTTVRFAMVTEDNSTPGASEELLVVSEDDTAVRAFRLEAEQINIINKMSKGDQLILACAGSGKSVLLIAKCFKAARLNPDKKFLITCYNRNLYSLYAWFIERAGLQERNVDCCTFDGLCKRLLEKNDLFLPGGVNAIEDRRNSVNNKLAAGKIKDKYYGIFIDEVQMFEPNWYKVCYNLLENKDNGDHIFVICGDKTQEIKHRQKQGKAPWNVGKGYPVYRGGNKSIRIEKNFRNCIEINDYINRFAQNARALIKRYNPEGEFDPDMFLRGQAFRKGDGVTIKQFSGNAVVESEKVIESIKLIHDIEGVPYDEIAIAMYNRQYKPFSYYIESALQNALAREHIPFNLLYHNDLSWGGRYGDGGVSLITFDSVLGLDFQAVIVCGVKPLGAYDKTKQIKSSELFSEEIVEQLKKNISYLYVACTRAKDYLHIVLGESSKNSIYNKLLTDSKE
jgi:hypothetical protein